MEVELKTMKNESMTKKEIVESAMMCWEPTNNLSEEKPHEEPEKVTKKPLKMTEKQKTWRRTCRTYTRYKQLTKYLDQRI